MLSSIEMFLEFAKNHCIKKGLINDSDPHLLCGFAELALVYEADHDLFPGLGPDETVNIMLNKYYTWFVLQDLDTVIASSPTYSLHPENPDKLSLETLYDWVMKHRDS